MGIFRKNRKYITLKEAAKISGYSPDYIGQLIRQGKIAGKQVYFNVAWFTTEEEILKYLKERRESRQRTGFFSLRRLYNLTKYRLRSFMMATSPWMLFKSFLYSLLIIIALSSLLIVWQWQSKGEREITKDSYLQVSQFHNQEITIPILP